MALTDIFKRLRVGRRRVVPARDTKTYPNLVQVGRVNQINRLVYKASPRNLRYFSRTPMARRAINAIKNPLKLLAWEVVPLEGVEWNSTLRRQAEIATNCLAHPNESDDFESFLEQFVEDWLIGAAAAETQVSGDALRPLWIWPVDGLSIQIYPMWDGNPGTPRYAQTVGYGSAFGGGQLAWLRDDELMYLRPNPNTATPFGFGPLEIAFNTISRLLGVGEFAGNVAANNRPSILIDIGEAQTEDLLAFRAFWRNDVEGQGATPVTASNGGKDGKPGLQVLRLYPEGDAGLYLKYQEFLIRELGASFDLSPQNFGIERDVNRSTSEVAEDRDWDQAIKPTGNSVSKGITRHCIHGRLGFSQLRHRFKGLDREDELTTAQINQLRWSSNNITADEARARYGEPAMDGPWGNMTKADVDIAIAAARGAKQVDDEELKETAGATGDKDKARKDDKDARSARRKLRGK